MRRLFFDEWGNELPVDGTQIPNGIPLKIVESYLYTMMNGETVEIVITAINGHTVLPYVIQEIIIRQL